MNKKILSISILAVLMLVAISYATAINTTNVEKKESPLFRIRTRQAVTERIGKIIETIKTKFLGERIFFIPFKWLTIRDGRTIEITEREVFFCIKCWHRSWVEETCTPPGEWTHSYCWGCEPE